MKKILLLFLVCLGCSDNSFHHNNFNKINSRQLFNINFEYYTLYSDLNSEIHDIKDLITKHDNHQLKTKQFYSYTFVRSLTNQITNFELISLKLDLIHSWSKSFLMDKKSFEQNKQSFEQNDTIISDIKVYDKSLSNLDSNLNDAIKDLSKIRTVVSETTTYDSSIINEIFNSIDTVRFDSLKTQLKKTWKTFEGLSKTNYNKL